MMNKAAITSAMTLTLISGCAASPATIQADFVSSEVYADYSCETLIELRASKKEELDELSSAQRTKRVVDGVSNVVLLPGLASVISDSSKPLARAKGEMNALIQEYDRRCIQRDR